MNTLVERVDRVYEPLGAAGWPAGRPYEPEPIMTVARSAGDVLPDHVLFEVGSIDRMYLNVWVARLAYRGVVQGCFVGHRGHQYASTALMDPMTKAFVVDIHVFVAARPGVGVLRQGA
jgi:hypothetical protein